MFIGFEEKVEEVEVSDVLKVMSEGSLREKIKTLVDSGLTGSAAEEIILTQDSLEEKLNRSKNIWLKKEKERIESGKRPSLIENCHLRHFLENLWKENLLQIKVGSTNCCYHHAIYSVEIPKAEIFIGKEEFNEEEWDILNVKAAGVLPELPSFYYYQTDRVTPKGVFLTATGLDWNVVYVVAQENLE